MKKFFTAFLSVTVVFALAIPGFSQQARQVGVQRNSPDATIELLKQSMEERFDAIDEDEDGSLTKEEFKKLMSQDRTSSRTPNFQRSRTSSESRSPATSGRTTNTQDESDAQRRKLMDEAEQKEREKELDARFDKLDENEDGKLSKDEYLDAQDKALRERMDRAREQRGGGQRQGGQRQGRPMPPQRGP
ncbi:MAG: EF-hand domain-containing protein [Gammaproteobacteria bacterium]|nr:EF-hand domain-containing protein [Gammaproteobacteria bacterium]